MDAPTHYNSISLTRGTHEWCRAACQGRLYAEYVESPGNEHHSHELRYPSCVQSCILMAITCVLQSSPAPVLLRVQ